MERTAMCRFFGENKNKKIFFFTKVKNKEQQNKNNSALTAFIYHFCATYIHL
jgi:hypothetical protein